MPLINDIFNFNFTAARRPGYTGPNYPMASQGGASRQAHVRHAHAAGPLPPGVAIGVNDIQKDIMRMSEEGVQETVR